MRVVLDTNVLLSAVINRHGTPAQLIVGWRERRYDLLTSTEQLIELGGVARCPVLRARIVPSTVGRLIRDLRQLAEVLTRIDAECWPSVHMASPRSCVPENFSMCSASNQSPSRLRR